MEQYSKIVGNLFVGNESKRLDIITDKNEYVVLTSNDIGITAKEKDKSRIKTGLDIRGGARALVKPDTNLDENQMQELIAVSRNRFNIYGLSDIQLRSVNDLEGNRYMLIEIAGATPSDLDKLISQQGKFEAKIGNKTVFIGGNRDITDVCRNRAECAGIEACNPAQDGYSCTFRFVVYLNEEAAKRHAELTRNLSLDSTGQYLSEKLYLHVDDELVDELFIGSDLRGQQTSEISISGPGVGTTQDEAYTDAVKNMNNLQTILLTGSLPYKLEIVKLDTISPALGKEFSKNLLILALVVFAIVSFCASSEAIRFFASASFCAVACSAIL